VFHPRSSFARQATHPLDRPCSPIHLSAYGTIASAPSTDGTCLAIRGCGVLGVVCTLPGMNSMRSPFRKLVVTVGRVGALLLLITCTDAPTSVPLAPTSDVPSGPLAVPPSAFAVQLIGAGDIARC